jgi:hypothetical protein
MTTHKKEIRQQGIAKWMILLSLLVLLFIGIGKLVDVTNYAVSNTLYNILWMPMLLLLFVLPILSLIYWAQEKFHGGSKYLLVLVICIISVVLMLYK